MDNLKDFLDEKVMLFNQPSFIEDDPISIPHRFSKLQDIEISGFFAAVLAWGQRKTIINKSLELMDLMGNSPYDFVLNHSEKELKQLMKFKHRTFNDIDTLYFIDFFSRYYQENKSLEQAFTHGYSEDVDAMEVLLSNFHDLFFQSEEAPMRTRKHIASPKKKSACKRINMFLRWMVRKDGKGVDFGLWDKISPAQLVCPCDLHVDRIGRTLGLIRRKQTDWQTAMELTQNLRLMDAADPIKYDFALFGLGVLEKEQKMNLK
ncbi:TIGR02757 family protein [Cyclobacterium sp. 1_MG-2023]|uniref:TIGR02757 family protein n=1 Tax=Cyclobacterium sp. 1_MG-2023 TaxID=3062681 RepID=UPI0026E17074|nr:TIGR02757 family protein [Cyclobacterium sp. 1_MG-2023]MDO6437562.1 TIGR02757 family protein [Cyclobacterium sp. 1_MG-2023]